MKTKKMNYVLVPLSLIVLLTLGLVSVQATECPLGSDREMGSMGGMAGAGSGGRDLGGRGMRGGTEHIKMLVVALDFTDEQLAQVKDIVAAKRKEKKSLRQEMRVAQQQLRSMMESDRFDESAFRAQAEKAAAMRIDSMVLRAKTRQAIFAVMTSEQREKAKKLKQVMSFSQRCENGGKGRKR